MAHNKPKKPSIGKKLQLATLLPLVVGILLSALLTVVILFSEHVDWITETENYLVDKEKEHLIRVAISRSERIKSYLTNAAYDMRLYKSVYNSTISGKMIASSEITDPAAKYAYDTFTTTSYPNLDYSVWFNPTGESLSASNSYKTIKLVDAFMRLLYPLKTSTFSQIGLVITDGLDYRYPLQNMSYINGVQNYSETCKVSESAFDSRCTGTYYLLKIDNLAEEFMAYPEYSYVNQFLNMDDGAVAGYLFDTSISNLMIEVEDYEYFITHIDGEWVLALDKQSPTVFQEETIWNALFPEDYILSGEVKSKVIVPIMNKETTTITIKGMNSKYYVGVTPIIFNTTDSSQESIYSAGVMVNDNTVLQDWNDLIDDIINIIIIQMSIFLFFLLITLLAAWKLALSITHRITHPIKLIEKYLRGRVSLHTVERKYNKEVNQIIHHLRLLVIVERFIEPNYLNHPKMNIRLSNLKEAESLFIAIENNRGIAIVKNLIGNLLFDSGDYKGAINEYSEALNSIEELEKEVLEQEEEEKKLNENEKTLLRQKTGKAIEGWEQEKVMLRENISERIQQLCMAKQAFLDENSEPVEQLRSAWKEILALQTRALQHYITTRTHYIRLLKLLIDMAYVFQNLQYYHSAMELLDIVSDEIWKLENEGNVDIDIDITRLRRIGVNVKEKGQRKQHFHIGNIIYEKDILRQMMLYRRGMILKENEKFQEAGLAFTMGIEQGNTYDPRIRKLCIIELYNIMLKFGVIGEAPELKKMYENLLSTKRSILFVLCYDINLEAQANILLTQFVSDEIESQNEKFGVVTVYPNSLTDLEVVERDFPGMDLESLFKVAKSNIKADHPFDAMMRGLRTFQLDSGEKYMVVFLKNETENIGCAYLSNLSEILENGVKIIVIVMEDFVQEDFEEFLMRSDSKIIKCTGQKSFEEALEDLRQELLLVDNIL
ncbi:unnamed protein product [Blepharisma stoltei]|uniref:Uncharacterized protein n=1 Tax=Blepharisma stoltei TaxID=1481888 RepID=A0AAU9IKS3_9CILI|nr:unnamed protein product [Blepharisma stoltei]